MKKQLPITNNDGEVRELTTEDFKSFKPASEVLPASLMKKLGVRGPQKTPKKVITTIRLDADVIEAYRSTGKGWQTLVNQFLRDDLKKIKAV